MEKSCDGLFVKNKYSYKVYQGRRITIDENEQNESENFNENYFTFEMEMYPPSLIIPDVWQKYQYSLEDIKKTFDCLDACYLWQVCLLYICEKIDLLPYSTGIKSTFCSPFRFIFSNRKYIFQFLKKYIPYLRQLKSKNNILALDFKQFKPFLPQVIINEQEHNLLKLTFPDRPPSFRYTPNLKCFFKFRDKYFIGLEFVNAAKNMIYAKRITPKENYIKLPYKPFNCILNLPTFVIIQGKEYMLTTEACIFCLNHIHKKGTKRVKLDKKRKFENSLTNTGILKRNKKQK